jgi:integrase
MLAQLEDDGRRNALIYGIMLGTGLRKKEVASLTWNDIDLDAGILYARETWTKNRKGARLPLPPDLLAALREWKSSRPPESRVPTSPVVPFSDRLLDFLNDDLAAAGIEKCDASGRTVDLHALRHTFGTRLNAAGADVKVIQTLMRHSTPVLTIGTYVHTDTNRLSKAAASLPPLMSPTDPMARAGRDGDSATDTTPKPPTLQAL